MIKCSTSLAFYLLFSTRLINSIKPESSCKILFLLQEKERDTPLLEDDRAKDVEIDDDYDD